MTFDKNKVYTALNADEVKVGSIGVFADTIAQLKRKVEHPMTFEVVEILSDNYDCRFVTTGGMTYSFFYLTEEPEKNKYRPYKDTDEMIEDFKERAKAYGATSFKCPMFNSTIWVKGKERTAKSLIYVFYPRSVYVGDEEEMPLDKLFEYYTYLDGTPCGKKEGE